MKNAILTLMLAVASVQSFQAGACSPPRPLNENVIQLWMGGGMPFPGSLASRFIRVTQSGEVKVDEYFSSKDFNSTSNKGEERHYQLPNVNAADLVLIEQAVAKLKGGKLEEPNPSTPGCMDAPGYTYSMFKETGAVTIFKVASCKEMPLKDKSQRAAAASIKNYLDQLLALTHN